jgi:general stress protein 26
MELTEIINQIDLTDIQKTQKNIPSSQQLMKHSSKLTIYWNTKQVTTYIEKLKYYPAFYLTTVD